MSEQKKVAKSLQNHMTEGEEYTIGDLISLLPRTDYEFSEISMTPIPTEPNRPRWNRWVRNAVRNSPDRTDHNSDWWTELRAKWIGPSKTEWVYWISQSHKQLNDETASYLLEEADDIGVREGGIRYVHHRVIERNSRGLKNMKILLAAANKGKIACEGCGLDMKKRYGFPEPIIDCHHLYPLSELDGREVRTELSDLALLCPSCHRAIHKQEDCSDLDELRRRLSESHTR
jgi:predicted HNH restriction endonuclease